MAFVQTIEVRTSNIDAVRRHFDAWHAEQSGVAPGYQGGRILQDEGTEGRYLIEVDFSSQEEANRNNDRDETRHWAEKLRELVDGEPRFANHRLVASIR